MHLDILIDLVHGKIVEFMCWTLEAYMMAIVIFKVLYEEWSCIELSILQVCLEEGYCVNICVYLQDIIIMKKEKKIHG